MYGNESAPGMTWLWSAVYAAYDQGTVVGFLA